MSSNVSSSSPTGSLSNSSILNRSRKSKGKSRSGCLICKASRVKCDEVHPQCSRCKKASKACVYGVTKVPKWTASTRTLVFVDGAIAKPTIETSELIGSDMKNRCSTAELAGGPTELPAQLAHVPLQNVQSFNTQDVFLLLHFTSSTSGGLWGSQKTWAEDGVQLAFQYPFLMHAIIALAARHLQIDPTGTGGYSSAQYERLEAKHYQQALSIYSMELHKGVLYDHDAYLAAAFIFIYYSCSLKDFKPSSTIPSNDSSLTFIRGVRAIIHSTRFREQPGPLDHLLFQLSGFKPREPEYGVGKRLLNLINRMQQTSDKYIAPSFFENQNIYIERINSLTPYFQSCTLQSFSCPLAAELVLRFLRWQASCPPEFVELINNFDKIALAIMAHYYAAAACHLVRVKNVWWWWRDKPAYMVHTILDYLKGDEWEEWKEWPRAMLERAKEHLNSN